MPLGRRSGSGWACDSRCGGGAGTCPWFARGVLGPWASGPCCPCSCCPSLGWPSLGRCANAGNAATKNSARVKPKRVLIPPPRRIRTVLANLTAARQGDTCPLDVSRALRDTVVVSAVELWRTPSGRSSFWATEWCEPEITSAGEHQPRLVLPSTAIRRS